jgi:hypothetical protein
MTTFSNSHYLIKGALVGVDIFNPLAGVLVFQYNSDTMTRRLVDRVGWVSTVKPTLGRMRDGFRLSPLLILPTTECSFTGSKRSPD